MSFLNKFRVTQKLTRFTASVICILLVGRGLVVPVAHAASPQTATLSISPSSGSLTVGTNQLAIDVLLSTGGQGAGGVGVKLTYSANLQYASSDGTSSVFSTDVSDPSVSGSSLTFARVTTTPGGYIGSNGEVLHLVFNVTAAGATTVDIDQANSEVDESSTSDNILQSVSGGSYTATDVVPSAPTNLQASVISDSEIDLTWTAPAGTVTGYKVFKSTDGTNFISAGTPSSNSQNVTGLTASTQYTFKVEASNSGGDSPASGTVQATTLAPVVAPSAPTNVQASVVSSTAIDITWTASAGATSYKIGQATSSGAESQVATPSSSPYHATGLTPGTAYFFTVIASNTAGDSTASSEVSATTNPSPPSAPTSLISTVVSSTQINLSWSAPGGTVTGYKVYSSTDGTNFNQIATPTGTSQNVTDLTPSTQYTFKIKASNTGGDSAFSTTTQATTLDAIPSAPTGVQTTSISTTAIDLSWTAVSGATGYIVKQSTSSGTETQIATPSSSPYHATGLNPGTQYFFTVLASSSGGNSTASSEVNGFTLTLAPTNLQSSVISSSEIDLTWTAPAGTVTGYKVFQSTDGTNFTQVATPSGASQSITGLTGSTQYTFKIKATNAGGDSAFSATTQATTQAPQLTISSISVNPSATGGSISWMTNVSGNSQVQYGLDASYGLSTSVTDNGGVTSHTVVLSGIPACSTVHYETISGSAQSADQTLTTTGCPGDATVLASNDGIVTHTAGGTLSLLNSGLGLSLTVPANATATSNQFAIKKLASAAALVATGLPSNDLQLVSGYIYHLQAMDPTLALTSSFAQPLTVTISYASADLSGLDQSTLTIRRWDAGQGWSSPTGCVADTANRTLSCQTTTFSTFALFADATAAAATATDTSTPTADPTSAALTTLPVTGISAWLMSIPVVGVGVILVQSVLKGSLSLPRSSEPLSQSAEQPLAPADPSSRRRNRGLHEDILRVSKLSFC